MSLTIHRLKEINDTISMINAEVCGEMSHRASLAEAYAYCKLQESLTNALGGCHALVIIETAKMLADNQNCESYDNDDLNGLAAREAQR